MNSELLTASDVAAHLGGRVTAATVLRARRVGKLAGRKIGAGWHFTQADVDAWVLSSITHPLTAPTSDLPGLSTLSRSRRRRA